MSQIKTTLYVDSYDLNRKALRYSRCSCETLTENSCIVTIQKHWQKHSIISIDLVPKNTINAQYYYVKE